MTEQVQVEVYTVAQLAKTLKRGRLYKARIRNVLNAVIGEEKKPAATVVLERKRKLICVVLQHEPLSRQFYNDLVKATGSKHPLLEEFFGLQ